MWKLTIEDDEGQRTSLELSRDELSIGRAEDCSVRLTERNVSRQHAILRRANGQWCIQDCRSYNGTFVNGARVAEVVTLNSGDVVQLADYRIEVLDEAAAVAAEAEAEVSDPVAAARRKRPDRLVVVIGPVPGVEYHLTGRPMIIGRAEECGVSINHTSVSRNHAELLPLGDGRYEIIDQGSANGIRINGVELRRGILEPGDALELGDVRLRFVAAGKYFRPAVDLSQQLPAMVPFEATTPSPPAVQRSIGKIVAVGVGIAFGVVLVAGYLLFGPGRTPATAETGPSEVPTTTNLAAAQELLTEAVRVAESDIERAHKMLKRIPEGSPVRELQDFKDLEAQWADAMFAKVAATDDTEEQRRILTVVSQTPTVDADRRKRAADMLLDLGPTPATATVPAFPVGTGPGPVATVPATGPDTDTEPPVTTEPPTATTTEATTSPPPATEPTGDQRFDEAAQRRALEPKVWSGQATEAEIRMLRAICSNQGDRICRDRATQMLKQKQAQKGGGSG